MGILVLRRLWLRARGLAFDWPVVLVVLPYGQSHDVPPRIPRQTGIHRQAGTTTVASKSGAQLLTIETPAPREYRLTPNLRHLSPHHVTLRQLSTSSHLVPAEYF